MFGNLMRQIAGKPKETAPAVTVAGSGTPGNIMVSTARGELPFLDFYDANYAPLLAHRAQGFRVILETLERRCLAGGPPALIVETGSMRFRGNWAGDGQSTVLWNSFALNYDCEVHTVDLAPEAAVLVREDCGPSVHAHTGDSVAFLHQRAIVPNPQKIDLLYLDSFDFDPADPFPSAFHHIKELIAVRPCLGKGSIVAIDDNLLLPDGSYTGKGYLAMQWFDHLGIKCLHQGYQYIWQM